MTFIHYRTRGFVFKKTDRFEADRIFTIFTYDFGKLEVLAKAIRKTTSKLRAGIEIFYLSEIEFVQGKTYKTLTDAIAIEKFGKFKKDLGKLKIAFKISEVLDNFLKFEEKDKKIWNLILDTFQKLNNLPVVFSQRLFFYFLWNFFSVLGYEPQLHYCTLCQKKLVPKNLYFSFKEGGIICQDCFGDSPRMGTVPAVPVKNPDIVKILRIILKKDWETFAKLKINPTSQKLLKNISENYYFYLLWEYSRPDKIKYTYER